MRRDAEPVSHLHRLLLAGEFVVTAEMQTSDSADPTAIVRDAETLRGFADAVNCTDNVIRSFDRKMFDQAANADERFAADRRWSFQFAYCGAHFLSCSASWSAATAAARS